MCDLAFLSIKVKVRVKVNFTLEEATKTQRVGRGIALLFHDRDTRRGWVVSSTPRPHFTPGKDPVPILQEAGWAPGPVGTGAENLPPPSAGIRSPHRPAGSNSLERLRYPGPRIFI